ncbi:CapA family protein [Rhodocyclus tenuis]|nr:CapA family protein [Rhodocyclus tenuis]MBK1680246.1 poly-gamma-glutamate biosynthesis protein [Rhodocyclus tenuis]
MAPHGDAEEKESKTPAAEESVALLIVGDIMLAETPGRTIARGRDPFEHVARVLDDADVRIGNLECVIARGGTPEAKKTYVFRAHPRVLKPLKRHFDGLALANNHSGDYGPVAFREMLQHLERAGIDYFGGGHTLEQAHQPLLIERKGLRIAILAYNEFLPRSFEADADHPGIAWSEDEQVRLDIASARDIHHADLVIPFMHWGWENEALASPRQRQLARLMIDAGADAVVGGHPHVTQDVEKYRGKPIIYSLGNFVFDGFSDKANNTGWLLRLQLDRKGVRSWRTFVAQIDRDGTPHLAPPGSGSYWQRAEDG